MNETDAFKIVEAAAAGVEAIAGLVAVAVPPAAPYAVVIAAFGALGRKLAQAIAAGADEAAAKAALDAADLALSAALAGLPRRLAANDTKVDAALAEFEESHTPPDGSVP